MKKVLKNMSKPQLLLFVEEMIIEHGELVSGLNKSIEAHVQEFESVDLKRYTAENELKTATQDIEKLRQKQKDAIACIKTVFAVQHPDEHPMALSSRNLAMGRVIERHTYDGHSETETIGNTNGVKQPTQEVLTLQLLIAILTGERVL